MQEILIKKDILKEGYQKASEKLTLLFLLNPVSFYGQSYQKEKGSGTSDQLLFRVQNKFKNIPHKKINEILPRISSQLVIIFYCCVTGILLCYY